MKTKFTLVGIFLSVVVMWGVIIAGPEVKAQSSSSTQPSDLRTSLINVGVSPTTADKVLSNISGTASAVPTVINGVNSVKDNLNDPQAAFVAGVQAGVQAYSQVRPILPPSAQGYGDLAVTGLSLIALLLQSIFHKQTVNQMAASLAVSSPTGSSSPKP